MDFAHLQCGGSFRGQGAMLAIANEMGFRALGVDLSAGQWKAARRLRLDGT